MAYNQKIKQFVLLEEQKHFSFIVIDHCRLYLIKSVLVLGQLQ